LTCKTVSHITDTVLEETLNTAESIRQLQHRARQWDRYIAP